MARKKHAKGNQVNTQTVTERGMGEKEEKRRRGRLFKLLRCNSVSMIHDSWRRDYNAADCLIAWKVIEKLMSQSAVQL